MPHANRTPAAWLDSAANRTPSAGLDSAANRTPSAGLDSAAAPRRVAVAGGGTAGHVLAGVAIAAAYRKLFHAEAYFIGCDSGFEMRLAPARGEELTLIRGLPYARQSAGGKLFAIWKIIPGVFDARRLLRERNTEVLVGVGGYPSISAALAAKSLGIPVIIHEANAGPGLANRLVGLFADFVCTGFEETVHSFHDCPAEFTGSPPGVDLRGMTKLPDATTVLVAGGSEGSPFLNREIPKLFTAMQRKDIHVWHLAGQGNVEPVKRAYEAAGVDARVDEFIDNMETAYAEACLVISCPGALTLAEVAQAGLPSMLVPLSTAANDHQAANARSFCARTGAHWVAEREWDTAKQAASLGALLDNSAELARQGEQARAWARPDAAAHVVHICEEVVTAPARGPAPLLRKRWVYLGVALAAIAGFVLRVWPSFHNVFTPEGINFQEYDPWFHVRTIQNLLAHFPRRSGFDPYAVFPGGANIPTGPFWDYLISTVAWVVGGGAPTFATAERTAAWMPAVLGTWLTLPVFWLMRRLFDDITGLLAAWWIAIIPGTMLWTGHLGMADHHIAESVFAFFAIGAVCAATEARGWRAALMTLAGGLALGAYLGTRPAGIFVVGILVTAALLEPVLARIAAIVLLIAGLLFIPISGVLWSAETWLALGVGIALTLGTSLVELASRRRHWSRAKQAVILFGSAAVLVAVALVTRLEFFKFLLFQLRRATGAAELAQGVQEVTPLLRAAGRNAWEALFYTLGYSWILALPALVFVVIVAQRKRRPALTLFAVWSVVMAIGAFAQLRMTVYFGVNAAMLAGIASGWMIQVSPRPLLRKTGITIAVILILANLPFSLLQMRSTISPTDGWRQTLEWLRNNTPEPMGDPAAWTNYYPALEEGSQFQYPSSAYSVLVWWDFGYWVEYIARRIPTSNGTQAGAADTARFYTETDPAAGLRELDRLGSRYIVTEPTLGFDRAGQSRIPGMLQWAHRPAKDYYRVYVYEHRLAVFYLPAFYRMMATRLVVFDGNAVKSGTETWVVHTEEHETNTGGKVRVINFTKKFDNEAEARAFLGGDTREEYQLGGFRPDISCIPLDAVSGLKLAYETDPHGIKVFERVK